MVILFLSKQCFVHGNNTPSVIFENFFKAYKLKRKGCINPSQQISHQISLNSIFNWFLKIGKNTYTLCKYQFVCPTIVRCKLGNRVFTLKCQCSIELFWNTQKQKFQIYKSNETNFTSQHTRYLSSISFPELFSTDAK